MHRPHLLYESLQMHKPHLLNYNLQMYMTYLLHRDWEAHRTQRPRLLHWHCQIYRTTCNIYYFLLPWGHRLVAVGGKKKYRNKLKQSPKISDSSTLSSPSLSASVSYLPDCFVKPSQPSSGLLHCYSLVPSFSQSSKGAVCFLHVNHFSLTISKKEKKKSAMRQ